ncbi:hypothetical protein CASFOL_007327 [Castilleja foliolosa]|uniref:Peptidase A1 domain-containing protein n=1 Tax=Castilleja foliolosa TaxID=1961234 RepID=A0ABD3E9S4_9LAMI
MATLNSFIPSMFVLALFILPFFPVKSLQASENFQFLSLGPRNLPSTLQQIKFKPNNPSKTKLMQTDKTLTLPVQSGKYFKTDKYIVTFGLGSPHQELSLAFNTVSNLIWARCSPDIPAFRLDLYFNPTISKTYYSYPCNSVVCTNFFPNSQNCNSNKTCIYSGKYDDHSVSDGIFSEDNLNMTGEPSNFIFLCVPYKPIFSGIPNFSGNAGLLGLGRGDLSLPGQIGVMYNNYFSYCLPSNSDSIGYLTFGKNNNNNNVIKFTTLFSSKDYPSFYFIRIVSISVGGRNLQIDYKSRFFQNPGTVIDSGTLITRLPVAAYASMRDAFVQLMKDYPVAPAYGILDTCYRNTTDKQIDMNNVPPVSFTFDGNVTIDFDASGIFYVVDSTLVCFAFANNTHDAPYLSVFGNAQQKKMEVVYDVGNQKLGFRPNGCD